MGSEVRYLHRSCVVLGWGCSKGMPTGGCDGMWAAYVFLRLVLVCVGRYGCVDSRDDRGFFVWVCR